jgi:hypothetical protein
MPLAVESDKPLDPVHIGLFRANAVMSHPDGGTDRLHEWRRLPGHGTPPENMYIYTVLISQGSFNRLAMGRNITSMCVGAINAPSDSANIPPFTLRNTAAHQSRPRAIALILRRVCFRHCRFSIRPRRSGWVMNGLIPCYNTGKFRLVNCSA